MRSHKYTGEKIRGWGLSWKQRVVVILSWKRNLLAYTYPSNRGRNMEYCFGYIEWNSDKYLQFSKEENCKDGDDQLWVPCIYGICTERVDI